MTVRLFGTVTTDVDLASIFGGFVSANYLLAFVLCGWILYELQMVPDLKQKCGTTMFLIVGGAVGVIFMCLDTQIALLMAPREESEWPSILSWLGFSYVGFLTLLLLRFVYSVSKRNSAATPGEKDWTKSINILVSLVYVLSGFVIFLLCTLMATPHAALQWTGMALYLTGPGCLVFLLVWIASKGIHKMLNSYAIVAAGVTFGLSMFAAFYFIKDGWARYIDVATETVILLVLCVYTYVLLDQFKSTQNQVAQEVPLMYDFVHTKPGSTETGV